MMPSSPAAAKAQHRQPPAGMQHGGDVMLFAEISDAGMVCEVRKLAGFDADADQEAIATAKAMRFSPARKNGHPVPVVLTLQITFWRDANGKLVMESFPKAEKQADSPALKDSAPVLQ
jgi:Gram-negative bacterial TonB protein C-terminal